MNIDKNIPIFDRVLLQKRRKRALSQFSDHDFLFTWANDRIAERLNDIKRSFPFALQIGGRSDSAAFSKNQKIDHLIAMDCNTHMLHGFGNRSIVAEEDIFPFANHSLDLILSVLSLHSVNDLPGALIQMRRALKPDGFFVAAMFGGETLRELREVISEAEILTRGGVSPRVFPFADKQQMGSLLQRAGFALPVVDSEIITVTYDHMFKLLYDIRGMGESNIIEARDKAYVGRDFFSSAAKIYHDRYAEENGRITASFEIIFIAGWAPHESQQQPMKPGGADMRLSDALHTNEIDTGDKATP